MKTDKPITYEVTIKRNNSSYDDVRIVSVSKNSAILTTLELFPSTKIVSIRICEQW